MVRLLTDYDDIEASVSNARATPRGRLRVDVGTSVARQLIIPKLSQFYQRYPDIQLDLGVSDRIVDLISDNVDCVIRGGNLIEQSLVARRIGNLEFITVASPAYLALRGTPTHPLDIEREHHTIAYFGAHTSRQYPLEFHAHGEVIEIPGPNKISVNESGAYIEAVLAGLGIGQISTFQAERYLASGEMQRLLPDWGHPLLPVYVVYPPNRHLSAKVRAFVDWAAELFAAEPHLQRVLPPL